MVKYTTYNSYPYPEKNETGWHDTYTTALVQIDEDIETAGGGGGSEPSLVATQELTAPIYADLTNHPSPTDGDLAYADGTGVDAEGLYTYNGTDWSGPLTDTASDTTAQAWDDLADVEVGTLANRPAAGTAGLFYVTTDIEGVYYDNGSSWTKALLAPGDITSSDLAFDPVTEAELDTHVGQSGIHHSRYSDTEARSAVTGLVDAADLAGGDGIAGQALFTDGNQAFWDDASGSGGGVTIADGTVIHTTGSPTEFTIPEITSDERAQLEVSVAPSTEGQTTNDYAFNYDMSQRWDSVDDLVQCDMVLNWDIDSGVNMEFRYEVRAL